MIVFILFELFLLRPMYFRCLFYGIEYMYILYSMQFADILLGKLS